MTWPPVRPPGAFVLPSRQVGDPSGFTLSTIPTWLMRSTPSPGKSKKTTAPTWGRRVHRPCFLNHAAPTGVYAKPLAVVAGSGSPSWKKHHDTNMAHHGPIRPYHLAYGVRLDPKGV